MSEVAAYGLAVDPPAGWESRIYQRERVGEQRASDQASAPPGDQAPFGAVPLPVAQFATIPIPSDAADYGSDVVDELGPQDAFIVLKEFESASAGEPLFATEGLPRILSTEMFTPSTLQRQLDGQGGYQAFFHVHGRAFCLYVVLGGFDNRNQVVPRVNQVLATLRIDAPTPAP